MEPDIPKKHKGDDLEVTGVSRSGRVRKKSSKLMDFESPDDIDTSRPKRPAPSHHQRIHPSQLPPPHMSPSVDSNIKDEHTEELSEEDFYDPTLENPNDSMESDSDDGAPSEESQMTLDNSGGGSSHTVSRPGNSIYMMEKSNKKKLLIKDGRIVGRAKAQRKDKGKSRVTAYMMWAKSARNDLLKKHPDMEFAAISKRLGEMWANVNYLERYVWKRRAKRYAASKTDQTGNKTVNSTPPAAKLTNSSQNHHTSQTPAAHNTHSSRSRQSAHSKANHNTSGGTGSGTVTNSGGSSGGGGSGGGMYRVVGVGPVEVGAHLRLLGESLTIIGERLKEHEGQIAVSGSVSVLLDTLLCSLAPLVCLTAHIPSIAPPVPLLQETLDNIAYIMPGL